MYKQTRTVSHVGRTPCVTVLASNLEPSEQSWGRVESRALYPRRRSGNAILASQYFNVPVSRDVQQVFVARDVGCRDGSYVVITDADQLDAVNTKALRMEIETRVRSLTGLQKIPVNAPQEWLDNVREKWGLQMCQSTLPGAAGGFVSRFVIENHGDPNYAVKWGYIEPFDMPELLFLRAAEVECSRMQTDPLPKYCVSGNPFLMLPPELVAIIVGYTIDPLDFDDEPFTRRLICCTAWLRPWAHTFTPTPFGKGLLLAVDVRRPPLGVWPCHGGLPLEVPGGGPLAPLDVDFGLDSWYDLIDKGLLMHDGTSPLRVDLQLNLLHAMQACALFIGANTQARFMPYASVRLARDSSLEARVLPPTVQVQHRTHAVPGFPDAHPEVAHPLTFERLCTLEMGHAHWSDSDRRFLRTFAVVPPDEHDLGGRFERLLTAVRQATYLVRSDVMACRQAAEARNIAHAPEPLD